MDIPNLLFNPNGRIGVRDFWRGAILLTGFLIIAQVIGAYGPFVARGMFGILTIGTVYSYLCVYGKRLHDGGRSGWFFLAFLAGFLIFANLVNGILIVLFVPEAIKVNSEMWNLLQRSETEDAMAQMVIYNRMTIIPLILTLLAGNALLAHIGGRLRSDPNRNEHGEPTSPGDTF